MIDQFAAGVSIGILAATVASAIGQVVTEASIGTQIATVVFKIVTQIVVAFTFRQLGVVLAVVAIMSQAEEATVAAMVIPLSIIIMATLMVK